MEANIIDQYETDLARISTYFMKFDDGDYKYSVVFEVKSKSGQYVPVNVVLSDNPEDVKDMYCQGVGGVEFALTLGKEMLQTKP